MVMFLSVEYLMLLIAQQQ